MDDVDHERLRLKEIVKAWVLEPTDQPWGNRSMLFRDPDGNLINLYARIAGEGDEPDYSHHAGTGVEPRSRRHAGALVRCALVEGP